jgi:hypothetical protein
MANEKERTEDREPMTSKEVVDLQEVEEDIGESGMPLHIEAGHSSLLLRKSGRICLS